MGLTCKGKVKSCITQITTFAKVPQDAPRFNFYAEL